MKNQTWKVARRTVICIVGLATCSIVMGSAEWGYECAGPARIISEGCGADGMICASEYSDGSCAYSVWSKPVSQCFPTGDYLQSCDDFAKELNPPATFVGYNGTCGWQAVGESSYCLCSPVGPPVLGGQANYSCK
jgi:hypothetical protein